MTKRGTIKKTALEAYSNPRSGGIIAIHLDDEDELISAKLTDGKQYLFIGTKWARRFIFPKIRLERWVHRSRNQRIKISKDDEVVGWSWLLLTLRS